MKITNKLGLPAPFVSMCKKEYECEPNEYRVTSLLKGIRETILERRHHNEIEQDTADLIWLLFGTAVHGILEKQQETETQLKENRLKVKIGNYILSGQFDLYDDLTKTVTDYKTCSVWKVIYGDYTDWRRQCLIYCWMLRRIGFDACNAEIVAIMKDHKKSEARFNPDYPQYPVKTIRFEFAQKDFDEIEIWLYAKFALEIPEQEALADNELNLCTAEERYNKGDKYAVMKKGNKRALRVLDSQEEAADYLSNNGDFIEVRKGVSVKCLEYCSACEFCDYYKKGCV